MFVRFNRRVVFETLGRNRGPVFEAGSVHEMAQDQAARWISRGLADPFVPEPEQPEPVDDAPEADPEPEAEPEVSEKPEPFTPRRGGRRH